LAAYLVDYLVMNLVVKTVESWVDCSVVQMAA